MKKDDESKTIPTVGFNVENLKHKGHQFAVWDLGGQDTTRYV